MKEYAEKMQNWWVQLVPRERRMLIIGVVAVFVFIIYQMIWSPLTESVNVLRKRIQTNQQLLAWMQVADESLQKISGATNSVNRKSVSPVTLLGELEKQIKQQQLEQSLADLKQSSNDSVEIHFQKIDFDKLMRLLIKITKENSVMIAQLSVSATEAPGTVNADVVLRIS